MIFADDVPDKLPSPAPRASLGRDESIEDTIRLAIDLEPMALIGAGGIDSLILWALPSRLPPSWVIPLRLRRLSIAYRILCPNEERKLPTIVTLERARRLNSIVRLLLNDKDVNAAEKIAESIKLREKNKEDLVQICASHQLLVEIYRSKGNEKMAAYHHGEVLRIASSFHRPYYLFWAHYSTAALFFDEAGFDDAQVHVEQAKLRALDSPFRLGHAVHLQALIWYRRRRLQDAASEAVHAQKIFEKLGNSRLVEICKTLLKDIKGEVEGLPPSVS
jgi:hypothetical protein